MLAARSSPKLAHLQSLRGVAALLVVGYHFRGALDGGLGRAGLGERLLFPGAAGVDLFFLLSGLVMARATRDSPAGAGAALRFLLARLLRVWPPYLLASVLFVALTRPLSTRGLLSSLLFIPLENRDPPFYGYARLIVGWTLNYEMVFYLLIATTVLLAARWRLPTLAALVGGLTLLLPWALAGAPRAWPNLDPFAAPLAAAAPLSLAENPLALEFLVGALLGHALSLPGLLARIRRGPEVPWSAAVLSLWTAAALLLLSGARPSHGLLRWGLPALCIVVGALLRELRGARVVPALRWLGEISYSLYLVHPLVGRLLEGPDVARQQPLAGPAAFALATALSLAAAALFHRLVERPALRMSRWPPLRDPVRAPAAETGT